MKYYYKFIDENKTECFLEMDSEFYCERAIFKTQDLLVNTYLTIEKKSCFLPEGCLKECLKFMNPSSIAEFDTLWNESMKASESDWNKLKKKYKIGDVVDSKILCFYPQGVISNFGEGFNALSDYESCKEKFGDEHMSLGYIMKLIIAEFDDTNKIIHLNTNAEHTLPDDFKK
ncbi:hypothetical protein [Aureibacter tunicatorum]|uniref:S1 motif domain-containing protein n=1 Tax=Aureibacter tunicatorum TaxID=866807 RepID=A0AAE3XM52_9BACT|nr:hypothetical protein [Aureibacter tunicatorum]MDR6238538.1 hypothetical protein [Aureibacter tunicatorum]BDD05531.1 hypothetical protein AUTU_30140 [Aureibacter tunicatorum]